MYGDLIFSFATAWAQPLTVLVLLTIILDFLRQFLFKEI